MYPIISIISIVIYKSGTTQWSFLADVQTLWNNVQTTRSNVQHEYTSGKRQGTAVHTQPHTSSWTHLNPAIKPLRQFFSVNTALTDPGAPRKTPYDHEAAAVTIVEGAAFASRCCHRRVCSFWQNISLWNLLAIHLLRHTKQLTGALVSLSVQHQHAGLNTSSKFQPTHTGGVYASCLLICIHMHVQCQVVCRPSCHTLNVQIIRTWETSRACQSSPQFPTGSVRCPAAQCAARRN